MALKGYTFFRWQIIPSLCQWRTRKFPVVQLVAQLFVSRDRIQPEHLPLACPTVHTESPKGWCVLIIPAAAAMDIASSTAQTGTASRPVPVSGKHNVISSEIFVWRLCTVGGGVSGTLFTCLPDGTVGSPHSKTFFSSVSKSPFPACLLQ
jgi:hypothetical protein